MLQACMLHRMLHRGKCNMLFAVALQKYIKNAESMCEAESHHRGAMAAFHDVYKPVQYLLLGESNCGGMLPPTYTFYASLDYLESLTGVQGIADSLKGEQFAPPELQYGYADLLLCIMAVYGDCGYVEGGTAEEAGTSTSDGCSGTSRVPNSAMRMLRKLQQFRASLVRAVRSKLDVCVQRSPARVKGCQPGSCVNTGANCGYEVGCDGVV